jgi:Pyridoxamine 5'-phosphate oxidase
MSVYTEIDARIREFIEAQHMFFVGTAPSGPGGHVNISPKGIDSLRVLGPKIVAYADYTGSGIETVAHLRENGRIVIMLCAFTGPPRIVRLHGRGEAIEPQDDGFASLLIELRGSDSTEVPPLRSIIRVEVERISDSCGYGVPLYEFEMQRTQLTRWASSKGRSGLREYQRIKNSQSIDGLQGLRWMGEEAG